jgi:hypothetical protein
VRHTGCVEEGLGEFTNQPIGVRWIYLAPGGYVIFREYRK